METFWLLFGLLGWAVAILLAFALIRMAGNQDRLARRMEMRFGPSAGSAMRSHGSRLRSEDNGSVSADGSNPG